MTSQYRYSLFIININYILNILQEMNKSGVWKSLESKPAETSEGERIPVSKDNTPDEGIVIKVSQLGLRGQLVYVNEKTLLLHLQTGWRREKSAQGSWYSLTSPHLFTDR